MRRQCDHSADEIETLANISILLQNPTILNSFWRKFFNIVHRQQQTLNGNLSYKECVKANHLPTLKCMVF